MRSVSILKSISDYEKYEKVKSDKMNVYIRIIRPNVCILASLSVFVGALMSMTYISVNNFDVIIAMISAFLICAGGNVINDCFDYKIDKINRPDRPLPKKEISLKNAVIYFWGLSMTGFLVASFVNFTFFNIAIISIIISSVYACSLKRMTLVGNVVVALLSSITFISGGVVSMSLDSVLASNIYVLSILAFTATMGREIYKDIEDMQGDRACGCMTLPIIMGETISRVFGDVFILVSMFIAISLYSYDMFNIFYLFMLTPCITMFSYSIITRSVNIAQRCAKMGMYFGIMAFICVIMII